MNSWTKRFVVIGMASGWLVSCGNADLSLTLLTPQRWSDGGALSSSSSFDVWVSWPGGDAGASVVSIGAGFSISVPQAVPLDVWVRGQGWRGERHGLTISSGGADVEVLMLPVGQVGSFGSLRGVPPLAGAAAVPLDLGRVLIIGGNDAGGAWIWDQAAASFTQAAPTRLAWAHHAIQAVQTNLFLLAGGDFAGTGVELYSPFDGGTVLNRFALAAPERRPSAAFFNGSVFVGCGIDAGGVLATSVQPKNPLADCADGQLVSLPSGVVAVGASTAQVEAGALGPFSPPSSPRVAFAAVAEGDQGILVVGGLEQGGASLVSGVVESLLSDGGVLERPSLVEPRAKHALVDLTPIGLGYLAVGGMGVEGEALASLEPIQSTVQGPIPLETASVWPSAVLVPGYRVVLVLSGETADGSATNGLDLYAAPEP